MVKEREKEKQGGEKEGKERGDRKRRQKEEAIKKMNQKLAKFCPLARALQ